MTKLLVFGPFRLDVEAETLFRGSDSVGLGKRAVALLRVLVERSGAPVLKDDLIETAWSGLVVEEANLTVQISALRRVLGQHPGGESWIETLARRGYRYVGPPATSEARTQPPPTETKGALSLPDRPSIAVLPFQNMSSDAEHEYFADGIVEDITTALSRSRQLFVIARNSSFTYKGRAVDAKQAGRELGVRYLLEGSVRKAGNRVRITAQLIDATTGGHLWAERYDRDISDIFEIQDDVTQQIVGELKVTLSESEKGLIAGDRTKNVEAHDLFLKGRALLGGQKRDRETFGQWMNAFQRAIELDPQHSSAYAGLAMGYALDHQNNWSDEPQTSLDNAQRFVDDAIARDDKNAFAHYVATVVAIWKKDYERWASEGDEALSLDPNFALAIMTRGILHIYTGEPERAIPYIERAMRLDPAPQHGQHVHFLGTAYFVAGEYEMAADCFKDRITINPRTDFSRAFLASALGHLGKADEAVRIWRELETINPRYSFADHIDRLPFADAADAEKFTVGLRKAGLRK
jgi:adenylate cyclase